MMGCRPASSNYDQLVPELCGGEVWTYIADWLNLDRAPSLNFEGESLDSTTGALKVLVGEEHLLQLRVGLTDVTELIVPRVDDCVGQPGGAVARLVGNRLTADDRVVVEGDRVVPTSLLRACKVRSKLLLASKSSLVETSVRTCVRHGRRDNGLEVRNRRAGSRATGKLGRSGWGSKKVGATFINTEGRSFQRR
jgi:hypothetical protein